MLKNKKLLKFLQGGLFALSLCGTSQVTGSAFGDPIAQERKILKELTAIVHQAHTASGDAQKAAGDLKAQVQQALNVIHGIEKRAESAADQAVAGAMRNLAQQARAAMNAALEPILNDARQQAADARQSAQSARQANNEAQQKLQALQTAFAQKLRETEQAFTNKQYEVQRALLREKEQSELRLQNAKAKKDIENEEALHEKRIELQKKYAKEQALAAASIKAAENEEMLKLKKAENQEDFELKKKEAADPDIVNEKVAVAGATQAEANKIAPILQAAEHTHKENMWKAKADFFNNAGAKIGDFISDGKKMGTVVAAIGGATALYYLSKHLVPELVAQFFEPSIISESSRRTLFGSKTPQGATVDELVFTPELQSQLDEIRAHLATAIIHKEACPNLLFEGVPGTGKTAFAKALATMTDAKGNRICDYALTSASEFAKIASKDLNLAIKNLDEVFNWARTNSKPTVIFFDEAESAFKERTLPGAAWRNDFVNAFLARIQDKSNKGIIVVFATNHAKFLDKAVLSRFGKLIKFNLPSALEIEKIFSGYLTKYSKENKKALVELSHEIKGKLAGYARELVGCSPRDIKYIAEQIVIRARRDKKPTITDAIVAKTIGESRRELEQKAQWDREQAEWVAQQHRIHA